MTLLQRRDAARRTRRLQIREETREELRHLLAELIPGEQVLIFGSLFHPGVFNDASDVDLALEREPSTMSSGCLMVELMERLGRKVDVVLLPQCRLRAKIIREARWQSEGLVGQASSLPDPSARVNPRKLASLKLAPLSAPAPRSVYFYREKETVGR